MLRKAALGLCLVLSVCATITTSHVQAQQTDKVVRLGIICGVRCEDRAYDALKDGLARLGSRPADQDFQDAHTYRVCNGHHDDRNGTRSVLGSARRLGTNGNDEIGL